MNKILKIVKNSISSLVSNIGALGLSSLVFDRIKRALTSCDPMKADPCNQNIGLQSSILSAVLVWIDYAISWIPVRSTNNKTKYLSSAWFIIKDIFDMWNFFAFFFLAAYAESNPDKDMDNYKAFLPAVGGAGIAAIISNKKMRDYLLNIIVHRLCPSLASEQPVTGTSSAHRQSWLYRGMDGLWEGLRGFAAARGLIAVCEKIHDAIWKTNHYNTTPAAVTRYAAGGIIGMLWSYIGLRYSAHTGIEKVFFSNAEEQAARIKSTLNDLITAITFGILTGAALEQTPAKPRVILIINFIALILADIIKGIYQTNNLHTQSPERSHLLPAHASAIATTFNSGGISSAQAKNRYSFWQKCTNCFSYCRRSQVNNSSVVSSPLRHHA